VVRWRVYYSRRLPGSSPHPARERRTRRVERETGQSMDTLEIVAGGAVLFAVALLVGWGWCAPRIFVAPSNADRTPARSLAGTDRTPRSGYPTSECGRIGSAAEPRDPVRS
jgi:hypothetical protein